MSADALDLKSTVNLPRTDFPQKANLVEREPQWLARWQKMGLYEQIRRARHGRPTFILHDGPPYANADIHIGTAMNKILKDFIVKSHSMLGYDAPFVPGYDCHGLPIELHVDRKLGARKSEMDPIAIRQACREHAAEALKRQTRDFERLGVLGEWENPYLTMSNSYEAETARLFGRFVERGLVYKGERPVYWCIHDRTALAEAEVEYKQHASPSVYVKFPLPRDQAAELERKLAREFGYKPGPLSSNPAFILIWTTTPWTLPANLGISVHPDYNYSAVLSGGEIYIVGSELVEEVAEKCRLSEFQLVATFPGRLLEGLWARHAWLNRPSLLMLGQHVTMGELEGERRSGTGCVHTAPGHGLDDFLIGQRYGKQLEPVYEQLRRAGALEAGSSVYCPVMGDGRFADHVERFAGMQVFEANGPIVELLKSSGALLWAEEYEHRYPHCWRCHKPVIFRSTPQWFISMDRPASPNGRSLREEALEEIRSVRWIPNWGLERMHNMLKGRPDWCISRQRVWGVPIPVFYCLDCNATIADPEVINHVADIFEKESSDAWYLRGPEQLLPGGFRCPACRGSRFAKEQDILDVWFDSGSSSIAVLERERNMPWPADLYIEGPDQYRGWFNSSLIVSLAAHDRAPYKTVITHGWTVDGEGRAMHKSLGNVISPNEVINRSGAEILRLWVASSDYREDMRLSEEILARLVDAYRKIRNTARFALGNLFDFDPETDRVPRDRMWEIDRWALAATNSLARRAIAAYREFEYHTVYHLLYSHCAVTLSAIYFDILKDRLYTFAPKSEGRRSAQTALFEIADKLARLLAPILSFTADEVWENLPGKREPSVHLALFPEPEPEDERLLARWEKLFQVRSAVQKALEHERERKVIGASLEAMVRIRARDETYELLREYRDQLASIFIVSEVELERSISEELAIEVERARGRKCERCWNWSETVGQDPRYPTLDARCIVQVEEGWGKVA
jgi:isoleucyl-tRNA synthetase